MRHGIRTIVAAVAILLAWPLSASSADPEASGREAYARETAGRQLEERAASAGSLGMYVDTETDEYVVVLPEEAASNFQAADAADLGLKVRVETREITSDTIDRIEKALVALRPSFPEKHSYVFGFNPETGLVEVGSDAPRSAFADVEKAYPGKISFSWAKLERTTGNWTADTPPHWGGAYLTGDGGGACTSGWTVRNQSTGTRYMVTAGHCFTNGHNTNMGTAWRENEAFPAIDVELIRGKTYAGYIYADGATGERAVNDGNNPVINSSYCITGRSSGFKCGWVAKASGKTYCYLPEGCTYNLFTARTSSNAAFQKGDSGGPFYIKGATRVGIRGIAVARSVDITGTWTNYVQGYKTISDYYLMPVVIP